MVSRSKRSITNACHRICHEQNDGTFKGQLKTLSITASLEIVKNASKKATDNQPDYRVVANKLEIGAAWIKKRKAPATNMSA